MHSNPNEPPVSVPQPPGGGSGGGGGGSGGGGAGGGKTKSRPNNEEVEWPLYDIEKQQYLHIGQHHLCSVLLPQLMFK